MQRAYGSSLVPMVLGFIFLGKTVWSMPCTRVYKIPDLPIKCLLRWKKRSVLLLSRMVDVLLLKQRTMLIEWSGKKDWWRNAGVDLLVTHCLLGTATSTHMTGLASKFRWTVAFCRCTAKDTGASSIPKTSPWQSSKFCGKSMRGRNQNHERASFRTNATPMTLNFRNTRLMLYTTYPLSRQPISKHCISNRLVIQTRSNIDT